MKNCNMCGKKMDLFDEQLDFYINKKIGYGSVFDGDTIDLRLCCDCMDNVFKTIISKCKYNPIIQS